MGQHATKSQASGSVDHQWFPDRFSAIGNVRVRSPTLVAATNQMNLFFEQKNLHPATASNSPSDPPGASSVRRWVSQPGASSASGKQAGTSSNSASSPASIRGDQVTAKLTFGDRELTATDLSVVGSVQVTHPLQLKRSADPKPTGQNIRPSSKPLLAVLTGDHLRIRDGGGSDVLQLGSQSDRPARLELGDGYFIGPEIQVRPDDNYVWIPAAGEFLIPSELLPSLGGGVGSNSRWSRSPRCRFGGAMTFDGQVATLSGGVDLEAAIVNNDQPSEIRMNGDELKFVLEGKVDFQNPSSFQATRLGQISLLQTSSRPVTLRIDQFAGDGIRQSRHEMVVASLNWVPGQSESAATMRPIDQGGASSALMGQIVAPGPGSYRGWIRGKAKEPSETGVKASSDFAANNASVLMQGMIEDSNTNRFQQGQTETIITGVHLIFQEAMRGDLLAKSLSFNKGVRIGRRVVQDFDETFEATDMDRLSQDEMTLDCDQVTLSIDPSATLRRPKFAVAGRSMSSPPALEVEASGGVVFRSRTERGLSEATADRCGYAVAKDLVTIEGIPGRPARFHQTDPTGKPVANLAIRTMTLRLKPFELVSSQVESFQTGALPAAVSKNR